jgi:hypothetical protein
VGEQNGFCGMQGPLPNKVFPEHWMRHLCIRLGAWSSHLGWVGSCHLVPSVEMKVQSPLAALPGTLSFPWDLMTSWAVLWIAHRLAHLLSSITEVHFNLCSNFNWHMTTAHSSMTFYICGIHDTPAQSKLENVFRSLTPVQRFLHCLFPVNIHPQK